MLVLHIVYHDIRTHDNYVQFVAKLRAMYLSSLNESRKGLMKVVIGSALGRKIAEYYREIIGTVVSRRNATASGRDDVHPSYKRDIIL